MTVLFPIITVKEILEYSCLYVLEMRKKNTCKRKKIQTSTCTQVKEVLVISKIDASTLSSFIWLQ